MNFQTLQLAYNAGVATITLNRPDKRNAISYELIQDLLAAFEEVKTGSALVLILTGAGKAFCSGMSVPRTYVSKIENEKATPTLSSLERLARALEVTVPDLLTGGERNRQEEIRELVQDQFVAEILPFVAQLNTMQMSSILAQLRDLTIRPRRTA